MPRVTLVPAPRVTHRADLLVWHALCAVAMVVMLVSMPTAGPAVAMAVLFAAGLAWCAACAVRRPARASYVRLGVCCLAMVVMVRRPMEVSPGATGLLTAAALVAVAAVAAVAVARPGTRRVARGAHLFELCLASVMAAMLVGVV